MSNGKLHFISVFAIVLTATALGCGRVSTTQDKNAQAVLTVETIQQEERDLPTTLDTSGPLTAWQDVSIGTEVSGYRISEIFVDVGAVVSKGQVLAKLDDTLLRAEADQRRAAVAEAHAALGETEANAARVSALASRGALSEQEVVKVKTAAATSVARLASAQAQLTTAEQRLNYATIVAPDFGTISARPASPGQMAAAGTELFRMIRQNRIEWRAEVSEHLIGKLKPGMEAQLQRADGSFANGKIRALAPSLDAATRRGTAYIDVKMDAGLRPGMFVKGSIRLGTQHTRLLPMAALSMRDGFAYAFVMGDQDKVSQRRVQVGRLFTDKVEVLEGLKPDDVIVASGAGFLNDGDIVRVTNAQMAQEQAGRL